jgi:hypothetical protein
MPAADRAELVAFLRQRGADGDADLDERAQWLASVFPPAV